jgi:hypothetical protein
MFLITALQVYLTRACVWLMAARALSWARAVVRDAEASIGWAKEARDKAIEMEMSASSAFARANRAALDAIEAAKKANATVFQQEAEALYRQCREKS